MPEVHRKKALIVNSFTDAGSGERFKVGETPMIEVGAFGNYEAAGLIRVPPVTVAAKPKRRAPRKAAVRKTAATIPATPETPATGDSEAGA